MAQSGHTPIQLYYSATASAVPSAGNLLLGELAINVTDGKIFFKDNNGDVQEFTGGGATPVTSISFGSTGLTPATSATGAVTVAGTLAVGSGGTGRTTLTLNGIMLGNGTSGVNTLVGTSSGQVPTWDGTTWAAASTVSTYPASGVAVSTGSAWGSSYSTSGTNTILALTAGPTLIGVKETKTAIAASNIDLTVGNYYSKTITTTTTFTVSSVATTGTANSFILDLTNGGSQTINWWSGVKWAGGTAPTLTTSGRDVLGFFTYDGGTTWTGLVLGKDVK